MDVRLGHAGDDAAAALVFESGDLSEGGAFLQSDLLLEIGDEVTVSIPLREGEPLFVAQGRIVWVTRDAKLKGRAGMGVEFTAVSDEDQARLVAFLRDET